MALPAYMTITGEIQGDIQGGCTASGREGTIEVQEFRHDVNIPRDPQSGLATGKRVHNPLTIVKAVDKASPLLYQALVSGEHLKKVEIRWFRIDPTGREEHYFTTRLEDAIVVSIKPWMANCLDPNGMNLPHMEEVSFTYRRVSWTYEDGGITAEDDWLEPRI